MTNRRSKSSKIAVIGLGYVGLPLAVEFSKSRSVLGFDIDDRRITELCGGVDRTNECSGSLLANNINLKFTSDQNLLTDCDVYIITVPTPVNEANRPNLNPLKSATKTVGKHLSAGDVVIYESTVFPGATEEVCVPILELESGLRYNFDFFCGYSPERINPGDKVNTLSTITKVVSGSTPEITDFIEVLYNEIISAGTWRASSIRVAEASKVIENTQRDLNIAFVNELSIIFDRLGIDTLEVLEAAGSKWNFLPFRPGMVGGHCIGVDPFYLIHKAEEVGYVPHLVITGREMNERMAHHAALSIVKRMTLCGISLPGSTIGVLGVTFKENCPDTRNSKVFELIEQFESWGVSCITVDPWADDEDVKDNYDLTLSPSLPLAGCDAIVVAVGHSQFRLLKPADLKKYCKEGTTPVLGDLKSLYDRSACESFGFDVFKL